MSFLNWLADVVGVTSAFVRATTSSIVARATRPLRSAGQRVARAVVDPVIGVVSFVVDLPARTRVEVARVGSAVVGVVQHPLVALGGWWRGGGGRWPPRR